MLSQTTDVLIVGAGPVGLALALTLARRGVRPLVIERATVPQTTSRAAVIHAHTLDVLDRIGVAGPMKAEGLALGRFAIRDRNRMLALFRFDGLPSAHNYLLMLPQDRSEAILLEALARLDVEVVRGVAFDDLRQDSERVEVDLATSTGPTTVSARWVVGTDGMHSAVRAACGIDFDGGSYEGSFVLADAVLAGAAARDEVSLYFSPDGLVVLAPLPGGRTRIVAAVDEAPEKPDAPFIQSLLDARGPVAGVGRVEDVSWSSRFRLHHRLARRYRADRVFLAGDAAHTHSPAGGQGMNTGLVDAYTLGRLLADVLDGRADATSLDHYEALRRPAAEEVLALADRLTTAAIVRSPVRRVLRNMALRVAASIPAVRRRFELGLSGLARASATLPD